MRLFSSEGKMVHFVGPCHMGYNHEGLTLAATKAGFDLKKLSRGEFVVFVPTHRKRVKIYGSRAAFVDKYLPNKLEHAIREGFIDIGLKKGGLFFDPKKKRLALNFCEELETLRREKISAREKALSKR